ncbi:MAG: hypothetical protein AAGA96_05880 [Verrucomicrobiota bacterium]
MVGFTQTNSSEGRDFGRQPIDQLMVEKGIDNHQLVEASTEQLTHKQVQRARKGRRLTANMQGKVLAAWTRLSRAQGDARQWRMSDLFDYEA